MKYGKWLASLLLASSLIAPAMPAVADEMAAVTVAAHNEVQQAKQETIAFLLERGVSTEWEAIGLARAGVEVPSEYEEYFYQNFEDQVKSKSGTGRLKITDVQRLTMAAVAIGKDPGNIRGFNLLDKIYNSENWTYQNSDSMTYQGNNGLIYALIALDTKNFPVPQDARWKRGEIVAELIGNQMDNGAWSLSIPARSASFDITAMALISLAPYTDQPEVRAAVDRAVKYLSEHQGPTGGFDEEFVGGISSEATSQVIIGLTANGIDPQSPAFTKSGIGLVDHLLSFKAEGGGFRHTQGDPNENGMATEQALQALVAYDLYKTGGGRLYDLSGGVTTPEPEPQPEVALSGPDQLKGLLSGSLLNVQKQKNSQWSPVFIQETKNLEGYFIVQTGETGALQTEIPSGVQKVFLVDNDKPYRYFPAEAVTADKVWLITFNQPLKNTTDNLSHIYLEDSRGQRVPVDIRAEGEKVYVTPKTAYTSGELYSLFITEPQSEAGKTLKQQTRKLFIVK